MSGIAGVVGAKTCPDKLQTMLAALRHRGPDGPSTDTEPGCVMGACSLELSQEKGSAYANSGVTVLLDGEIQNPRSPGIPDVRVALDLYQEHGRAFAAHMQGAFACAVWNGNSVVLARDPLGIRPLYWGRDGSGTLVFASELKALVGMVREVHELPPATVFSSEIGLQPYLPIRPRVAVPDSLVAAKEALKDALFRATQRSLADGSVGGVLLSGGLDSAVIAAIAAELGVRLPALTVGAEGAADLESARRVAKHFGLDHKVRLFDANDIVSSIPSAVHTLESFDEDCVSGALAGLIASQLAAAHSNCVLSGEGSDELLGGYLMLKELPDEETRQQCLERLIAIAHKTGLQRLDRTMMRSSVNYRTPFLDPEVVAFCLQVPVNWKVRETDDGSFVEKWLLREAFKDMLPEDICQRQKQRLSDGTGTDAIIDGLGSQLGSVTEFDERARCTGSGYRLNSARECYYYRLFKEYFPEACFEPLVARWDPNK